MIASFSRLSLLWKIMLSTSVAITLLFALTGWIVLRNAVRTTASTMEDEVGASFQAYQSLWEARAGLLASVSLTLSQMSDVRSAFGTKDPATIRDTANELWKKLAIKNAVFLVTDAPGRVIASVGGMPVAEQDVRTAAARFPEQVSGFLVRGGRLYQTVFTPVYLENVPQNVLVAGYGVDSLVAKQLKADTGGSESRFGNLTQTIGRHLEERHQRTPSQACSRNKQSHRDPADPDFDITSLALPEGEIVVKPSVSGGGFSTARYEPHEHPAARAHVQQLLAAGRTAMVQPYEPRVDSEGETALIYIGGRFSHAVHKDPMIRRGVGPVENLIANQVVTGTTATAAQRVAARDALTAAEQFLGPTTYARVDMVETMTRGPALLELELLDPVLFLTEHPESAATFARLLAEELGSV